MKQPLFSAGIFFPLTWILAAAAPVAYGASGHDIFNRHAAIVDKARQEQKLGFYTTMDPEMSGDLKQPFQTKYPFMSDTQIKKIAERATSRRRPPPQRQEFARRKPTTDARC